MSKGSRQEYLECSVAYLWERSHANMVQKLKKKKTKNEKLLLELKKKFDSLDQDKIQKVLQDQIKEFDSNEEEMDELGKIEQIIRSQEIKIAKSITLRDKSHKILGNY